MSGRLIKYSIPQNGYTNGGNMMGDGVLVSLLNRSNEGVLLRSGKHFRRHPTPTRLLPFLAVADHALLQRQARPVRHMKALDSNQSCGNENVLWLMHGVNTKVKCSGTGVVRTACMLLREVPEPPRRAPCACY